jgi:betaine-aldehyde dehydrogenase
MTEDYKMFIDGRWVDSESKETFAVINPATEEVIAKVPNGTKKDTEKAILAARAAFDSGVWSGKTPAERSQILWKLAEAAEKDLDKIAKLESLNVGKTLKYARENDVPFLVDNLKFFAGAARNIEGKSAGEYAGIGTSIIRREPIGVVGAILPWNYPLFIAIWKLAPALAAGNTLVLKPSSKTPLSLLEFIKVTQDILPKGAINVVTGHGEVVGQELATNPKVDMITVTGDTSTGRKIIELTSKTVKRLNLQLSGKAPLIVLPDASIDAATEGTVVSAFWNNAEDCTATTRVYVHESIYKDFIDMLVKKVKKLRVGDPLDRKSDMGPLISQAQVEKAEKYVKSALDEGAKLVAGGHRIKTFKKGFFFEPTVFIDVKQDMKICQEEIFAPVLAVFKYSTVDEAISKANGVIYGLAASVWGKDITTLIKVANSLKAGTVWINDHGILVSEMPHGGYKQSGFGKDLSMYSLEDYMQVKHVYIDQTGLAKKPWYNTVYGDKV